MTRIGSLCSGYGGLDMAVESVLGGDLAWVADNDQGASKILAHHFPSVPNLGDITEADWAAVAPVDILTAGFPCQPVSSAGKRAGTGDERWLFDDICAAVGRMVARPGLLVLENVAGLLSANGGDAMARVVHGLAALGYVGRYRVLRASDTGAPHKRERWFCVAYANDNQPDEPASADRAADQWPAARRSLLRTGGRTAADTPGIGWQRHHGTLSVHAGGKARPGSGASDRRALADAADRGQPELAGSTNGFQLGQARTHSGGVSEWPGARAGDRTGAGRDAEGTPADPERGGRDGLHERQQPGHLAADPGRRGEGIRPSAAPGATNWGPYGPAITRWERVLGRAAPPPTEPGRTGERLSPRFVEWMMGLPAGWVTDVPDLSRPRQLHALGNGVVPQQAALALRLLLGAIETGEAA